MKKAIKLTIVVFFSCTHLFMALGRKYWKIKSKQLFNYSNQFCFYTNLLLFKYIRNCRYRASKNKQIYAFSLMGNVRIGLEVLF